MKRILLTLLLLVIALAANAQYRMVGFGAWAPATPGSDSTYTATVALKPDLTGFSYFGTQIVNSMRVFTGLEQMYTIDSIKNQTLWSVQLWIKEDPSFTGPPPSRFNLAPQSQVLIYDPAGRQTIPQVPLDPLGATSNLYAAVDAHNARLIGRAEGVVIDTTNMTYVQSTVLQDAIQDIDTTLEQLSLGSTFTKSGPILREPQAGDTVVSTTVAEWINRAFYFIPPSISFSLSPSTTVYEIGTSNQIIMSGTTSNISATTLSNGELNQTSPSTVLEKSFADATSYSDTISFTPQQGGVGDYNTFQYSFQSNQDWNDGIDSGNITSTTRTIYGVYPILYGASSQDSLGVLAGDPYTTLSKRIEREGNKNVTFNGSNAYLYLMIPNTWSDTDFSVILDHNGFNVTGSFKKYTVSVSSTGLTNDWSSVDYTCYQWNILTTATNYEYTFNQ